MGYTAYQISKLKKSAKKVEKEDSNIYDYEYIDAVKYDGCLIEKIPKEKLTEDICLYALMEDAKGSGTSDRGKRIWTCIPKEMIDEKFAFYATIYESESVKYIPKQILTQEFFKKVVSEKGERIKIVPKEMLCTDIYIKALINDMTIIEFIPKEELTDEFYKIVISKKGLLLQILPEEKKTELICIIALKNDIGAFEYLPDSYKTSNFYKKIIKESPQVFQKIPKNQKTSELCELAVRLCGSNYKFVPKELRSVELCLLALDSYTEAIKDLPQEYITMDIYEKIISKAPMKIKYFGAQVLNAVNEEAYIKNVKKNWKTIKYIPEEKKTREICCAAWRQNIEALKYVPTKYITEADIIEALGKSYDVLKYMPKEYRTRAVYVKFLEKLEFSDLFKKWLLTDEKKVTDKFIISNGVDSKWSLWDEYWKFEDMKEKRAFQYSEAIRFDKDIIKRERELNLLVLVCSYYIKRSNSFVVEERFCKENQKRIFKKFEDYYDYLDGVLTGADLRGVDFSVLDTEKYDLTDAVLDNQLLEKLGRYDNSFYAKTIGAYKEELALDFSQTNELSKISEIKLIEDEISDSGIKIYYVTDLHLNHKLKKAFPNAASKKEIDSFVRDIVKKLISTADNQSEDKYLLIGGDVSFDFEISHIFYSEIIKYWQPDHIIVVLGNHELWGINISDDLANTNRLDRIISRYREMLDNLGIIFLHNSLYYLTYNEKQIITESKLLKLNASQLRKTLIRSKLIILGGVGFSGLNKVYNATRGIYQQTIKTVEEDKNETCKFEMLYRKVLSSVPKDNVIVLTHMPKEDWTEHEYNSNWIYVNGHTHNNRLEIDAEKRVYANNQIGYYSKRYGLKEFNFCKKTVDIFRYYDDGIYNITKTEYISFYVGLSYNINFNIDNCPKVQSQ